MNKKERKRKFRILTSDFFCKECIPLKIQNLPRNIVTYWKILLSLHDMLCRIKKKRPLEFSKKKCDKLTDRPSEKKL